MTARLRLSGVRKSWGKGAPVVRDVSVEVGEGEILTVLGPSGCGKSTLLRLIAGLDAPDAGTIEIDGRDVGGLEPRARDVAMVFQSYALYPHMTVLENIAVPLKLRGSSRDEAAGKATETAGRLGLSELLDRRPRQLSGGERQRVALARALVRDPKVFLLDEPLSNLDAQLRENARAELKVIFRSLRSTVVYVTHDQTEAMSLSDRVAVMHSGALEQTASPADVYGSPATIFVAGFVGSPRMNFLPGSLVQDPSVTLGIRPEDVLLGSGDMQGAVSASELLGSQRLLTVREGPLEIRAMARADVEYPARVRFALNPAKFHLFDATGRRIRGK